MNDDLAQRTIPLAAEPAPTVGTTYGQAISAGLQSSHYELATRWLERLVALLPIDAQSIFASHLLLDHIPGLIQEIGKYVEAPAEEDIAVNAIVVGKARELGQLRHQQRASLHQLLREYELLGEVLEQFVIDETRAFSGAVAPLEVLDVSRRVNRAVRVLMQMTAVTFIGEYTDTITEQATRLDRFNRAVSHELRNVLGTLQFGVEVLEEPVAWGDEPRRRSLIATIRRNSERAIRIIRSFERLPRSGIMVDTPSEQIVDVAELLDEVRRQLSEMATARGVELRTTGDFPKLYLDTGALELVLMNLISNAIKYSDPAKTQRLVEVTSHLSDGDYELSVADNGLGIPAEAHATVFERFTRAHAALDEQLGVEGTGLGLSIVDECVKSLGGRIAVESEEGVGTTFRITLPKKLPPVAST